MAKFQIDSLKISKDKLGHLERLRLFVRSGHSFPNVLSCFDKVAFEFPSVVIHVSLTFAVMHVCTICMLHMQQLF